jgi:hypothetical protein
MQTEAWNLAAEGIARLRMDFEGLDGFRQVVVPVDFAEFAVTDAFEDPRQICLNLNLKAGGAAR